MIISAEENWQRSTWRQLNHKRIACISGSIETRYNLGRLNGFREGLMDGGVEVDEALISRADFNTFSGLNVATQLLEREDRPTAIFCCSDLLAYGAMKGSTTLKH